MKTHVLLAFVLLIALSCQPDSQGEAAQKLAMFDRPSDTAAPEQRISPPQQEAGLIGNTVVRVGYGSPRVKGRIIWGGLVPYGEVWRTGANEATFVNFEQDVRIEGEPLPAGKYSLYTIPRKGRWTIIFNHQWDQWGTEYEPAHDALRVEVTPKPASSFKEQLEIDVTAPGLIISWENLDVPIDIAPAPAALSEEA